LIRDVKSSKVARKPNRNRSKTLLIPQTWRTCAEQVASYEPEVYCTLIIADQRIVEHTHVPQSQAVFTVMK